MGRQEELSKVMEELEARIRNRLVLPKTILTEMRKLSGKTDNALVAIDGLVADFREVKGKLEKLL